ATAADGIGEGEGPGACAPADADGAVDAAGALVALGSSSCRKMDRSAGVRPRVTRVSESASTSSNEPQTSHAMTSTTVPHPVATSVGLPASEKVPCVASPANDASGSPVAASQILATPSMPAVTICVPSRLNAAESTPPPPEPMWAMVAPVATSLTV